MPFFGAIAAYADEGDGERLNETVTSLLDGLDLTELQSYLDGLDGGFVFSFGDGAREILEYLLQGNLNVDYATYLNGLFSALLEGVTSLFPAFSQILAASVLCTVAAGAEGGALGKSTAKAVRFAAYALIILILSSMLVGVLGAATECVEALQKQVEIISPILITLTVLTGGSGTGAIFEPCAVFLSQGAIEIVTKLVFPATVAVIVFDFSSRLNPQISFAGACNLIKSIMKWVIGLTVAVFGLFITVQSSASSMFNGIFYKVTKYLVGNSVPIVGNFLSAGVDMAVMAGSLVRNSVGLCGIALLIGVILEPLLLLASFSLMLKLAAAAVQPLGESVLADMFTSVSKDVSFFIAGLLTVAFMYVLVIMLVINSAGSFI